MVFGDVLGGLVGEDFDNLARIAALSGANDSDGEVDEAAGVPEEIGECGGAGLELVDGAALLGGVGRSGEGGGDGPSVIAGLAHGKVDEGVVDGAESAVDDGEPGPDLGEVVHDGGEEGGQKAVHFVKIVAQRGKILAFCGVECGDAEVKVNVRVHAEEEVLEDDGVGVVGGVEGDLPTEGG